MFHEPWLRASHGSQVWIWNCLTKSFNSFRSRWTLFGLVELTGGNTGNSFRPSWWTDRYEILTLLKWIRRTNRRWQPGRVWEFLLQVPGSSTRSHHDGQNIMKLWHFINGFVDGTSGWVGGFLLRIPGSDDRDETILTKYEWISKTAEYFIHCT